MVCIDRRWAVALCCLILLAGCASTGPRTRDKKPEPEISLDLHGEPLVRIADPYASQTVRIADEVRHQFDQALVAMHSEDWSSAQRLLLSLRESQPQLSGVWVNLGLVYWRQGRLEDAEQSLRRALEVNRLNGDAYVQLAVLLRQQGQFDEAEALYRQALDVWPHNAEAHRNLGILYDLYRGRLDDALQHYEMAWRLQNEPNRELEGWIIDLRRRLAAGG